ncbi:uncharacterized protein zgc:112970 isoform X2 [Brienomyrus brachyistius]|nr:uncharacterized protein zgc:112970 isoform X2 [Brienomyrus brachyistius]XP_048878491.1 uncharacterized protein zgc:112970 isoform X2 [Brienomyrus brachyistius]
MTAGLGKRSINIPEHFTHTQVSDLITGAFPKLASVSGGWVLQKSSGGGGQRKLLIITPDPDGYSGRQLKAVSSNGKSTIYIVPLQDKMDTSPLPPDALEFENMPKEQCTTCKIMFPLPVLPEHIKNCEEEHRNFGEDVSEEETPEEVVCLSDGDTTDSSMCPVCEKAFARDIIEIHASDCGLRIAQCTSNEETTPTKVTQCFQSCEDILNCISSQVDDVDTFSVCVSRRDIFQRGMQQWQRQKKASPKSKLKVTFFGEAGVDTGALRKEFLTEMLSEIERKLFVCNGDGKGKNPVYCLNSLDQKYFRVAGEIMSVSLAQGGPPPSFLREWCYQYLCSGDADHLQVCTSDVLDMEMSLLIAKVNDATEDSITDLTDEIINCGYTGVVSLEKKDRIVRAIVLHYTMRVLPMLDQLRKGLQLYDLLVLMEKYPDICLPLFVPVHSDDRVNSTFIMENCKTLFSEKGSVRYSNEICIMNFFQDYLQDIEDHEDDKNVDESQAKITVGRVMQWITGQSHKPILPGEKEEFKIIVKFNHDCDVDHTVCFPVVSACSSTIIFPTAHAKTFEDFKNIMDLALCYGQSFDRV